jgi:antitoxin (DNA-binding transcriptional repressor) of toxin-antitoxin stability system
MLLIMSYMKTVTLREFKHQSRYQRMAHDGEAILVTHRGKPYFVALPPERASTFVGAARAGKPLTPKLLDSVLAEDEWQSSR